MHMNTTVRTSVTALAAIGIVATSAHAAQPAISLTPAQVVFDPQGLTNRPMRFETRPASLPGSDDAPGPGVGEPESLRFSFREDEVAPYVSPLQRQLLIYSVEDYQALLTSQGVSADENPIDQLKALLADKPETITGTIPVLPQFPSSQIFHAQPKYLDFDPHSDGGIGGSGVRFITRYAQDVSPITSRNVFYTFQGLTSDGKYYVSFFYPIRTSVLPANRPLSGQAYSDFAKNYTAYLSDTVKALSGLTPNRFTPNLTVLDSMIESLKINADSSAAPKVAASATEVVNFDPPTPNEAQDGACFAASIASTRADAWRCSVGNRIYDPCFTASDTKSVVCGANPITGVAGFKLNLTKPLPAPNKTIAAQRPWLIQLIDGAVCNFATGASGLIGDERVNYYCSDKSVIVGDLTPGEVWEASRSAPEGSTFGQPAQAPIAVVWQ